MAAASVRVSAGAEADPRGGAFPRMGPQGPGSFPGGYPTHHPRHPPGYPVPLGMGGGAGMGAKEPGGCGFLPPQQQMGQHMVQAGGGAPGGVVLVPVPISMMPLLQSVRISFAAPLLLLPFFFTQSSQFLSAWCGVSYHSMLRIAVRAVGEKNRPRKRSPHAPAALWLPSSQGAFTLQAQPGGGSVSLHPQQHPGATQGATHSLAHAIAAAVQQQTPQQQQWQQPPQQQWQQQPSNGAFGFPQQGAYGSQPHQAPVAGAQGYGLVQMQPQQGGWVQQAANGGHHAAAGNGGGGQQQGYVTLTGGAAAGGAGTGGLLGGGLVPY